jgi:Raf kinase inhibitor-like YbhB/YbcL family protein
MRHRFAKLLALISVLTLALAGTALAEPAFTVTSPDVKDGETLAMTQVFNGMGCTGENLSPKLEWANAPEGTKSFAVTVYDPDAPTGSGWWHRQIYDVAATETGLAAGIGSAAEAPAGSVQGRNDAGYPVFGGACPPPGSGLHHYVFTVFALGVDKLGIPADSSAAMVGAMLNMNALAKATLTATYERPAQ